MSEPDIILNDRKWIGQALRSFREEKGLSVYAVATAIKKLGYTIQRHQLVAMEESSKSYTIDSLILYLRFLGVEYTQLHVRMSELELGEFMSETESPNVEQNNK